MKQVYKFIFPVSIYHIAVFEMSLLIHYEISLNQFFQSNFFSSLQKLVITINLNSYNMKNSQLINSIELFLNKVLHHLNSDIDEYKLDLWKKEKSKQSN